MPSTQAKRIGASIFGALGCLLATSCGDSSDDSGEQPDDSSIAIDSSLDGVTPVDGEPKDSLSSDLGVTDGSSDAPVVEVDATPPFESNAVLYVGGGDGKISLFALDRSSGVLTPAGDVAAGDYPSFLAMDVAHMRMFAVLENSNKVASFSIAKGTGTLAKKNEVASAGAPTFVSVDHTGSYAMVANYNAGTTLVFSVAADGSLGSQTDAKSPGTNSHQIITDETNAFAFVPNKGSDTVSQFVFDATKGTLKANTPAQIKLAAGSGPRHLEFHPDGKHAYLINELDSTMTMLTYDSGGGTFSSPQTVSTLPAGFDPTKSIAAEVHVAPSGKFVYGSNRGHDSIVVFSVDATTKKLTLVAHEPSGGKTPRHFSIDPTGTFLFAANQGSSNVVTFRIDAASGKLTKLSTTTISSAAYFAAVAMIPK